MEKLLANWKPAALAGGAALALVVGAFMLPDSRPATPDFREFEAGPERKEAFFSFMQPIIEAENARLRENRERLVAIDESEDIGFFDRRWVANLADEYGLDLTDADGEPRPPADLVDALLLRVDEVPISLALAQAAKESGWGTSRFAREGNNFYGEWCFNPGCGIVPASRGAGKTHEVEAFSSPSESVASYMRNINTHNGYREFRQARKQQRNTDKQLSGVKLAEQLTRYSERRGAYVTELKRLIVRNDLDDLEQTVASEN